MLFHDVRRLTGSSSSMCVVSTAMKRGSPFAEILENAPAEMTKLAISNEFEADTMLDAEYMTPTANPVSN